MFGTGKYRKRAAVNFRRDSPELRGGISHRLDKLARRFGVAAMVLCCWTAHAVAGDVPATSTAPIKIAVFAFELEDFSAAGRQKPSPAETSYLARSTEEAKQQLLQSGRYSPIDIAGADIGLGKGQGLRNCGGCEAAIAMKLGADQALFGLVTKISMTEYIVRFQVSDARTGEVVSNFTTDLRMGTGDSWFRGVRWLMKSRMLAAK